MAMRVTVRQWRMMLWGATLLISAAAGFKLWMVVHDVRTNSYQPRPRTEFERLISSATPDVSAQPFKVLEFKTGYQHLVDCPINGYVKPVDVPDTKPAEPEPPKKTTIDKVLAVTQIIASPTGDGRAVVKYKEDNLKPTTSEKVLTIGAALCQPYDAAPFNGKLKEIKTGSAIFEWCGEDVEVHPARKEEAPHDKIADKKDKGKTPSLSDKEKAALDQHKGSDKTIKLDDHTVLIGSSDVDKYGKDTDALFKELRPSEQKSADGKGSEVVLGQIRAHGYIADNYGVQQGDVIVSVNGQPVKNINQAINWARENPSDKYDVVIRRKGKEFTQTILVPKK